MAHIMSIGENHSTCLLLESIDRALDVVKSLLQDEEQAVEKVGQYAIMVSLEEHNVRLDILDTFDDDPVVFGRSDYVEEALKGEVEEVKHGHWITWFENEDVRQAKCSECGMMFTLGKGRDIHYCGNCGARMDEVEE